ncbi:sugar phosphotransferase system protein [Neoasaia chiangmaiensis NBRC 101099]|uniref:PTS cellobiose transporter n=1 Tax=Neoasaia chiangmaiensis TaxID=320497 RepID=A0A1U9KM27_9PROT|nr:hopanoid biosynthesis-associated protein HpnK [Neoasaia chiangmaiensis]AQS86825.1 PTS cellobiose transporter [Neoasaia chiangmaiensis]GBR37313.1 sugar phosphotransferase system protein [Neoasaia chiangmaiensis NBRC 101099]GEN14893.1 hypothetical protein NCH01_13240 [Neoasaia chiangmaiensis]
MTRQLIVSVDDFGLSEEVNEAVEIAHRNGLLSTASLMVAGPASMDAVRRARRLPNLHVGLHVVAIEGEATLPPSTIAAIASPDGQLGRDQLKLGVDYYFRPAARRALAREIEAQFRAFARSGLHLDHANAHKHMHLHPTVGHFLIQSGLQHGLRHVRTPREPVAPIQAVETRLDTIGDAALRQWCRVLRWQIQRAGMTTNDWCFGIAWSGHMSAGRVSTLIGHLPPGLSEIYFHPATARNGQLSTLMPDYDHVGELDALTHPMFRQAVERADVECVSWDGARVISA